MKRINLFYLGLLYLICNCFAQAAALSVKLGIDVLEESNFKPIASKRIGLVTHPAGVNREQKSTIDILANTPHIKLVALFGPEHGLRGNHKADEHVDHTKDSVTGLPIHSLYGKTRRPTLEMLKGIDLMVIDLQDIGTRSYTYVSCLCYVMEECFKQSIPVVVLDRPNPLGGEIVDGPMRDPEWKSYVGYLPVPYVHGLTIGELARMALNEGWLDLPKNIQKKAIARNWLTVIPMEGWKRAYVWRQTNFRWAPTSPNIPTPEAVLGYPMTGLGAQLGDFKHGIGTAHPFRLLTYNNHTPVSLQKDLQSFNLPGLDFKVVKTQKGKQVIEGVYVVLKDWKSLKPTRLSLVMMELTRRFSEPNNPFKSATPQAAELFNKHTGSTVLWNALISGSPLPLEKFFNQWDKEASDFKQKSSKYYLYK